MEPDEKNIKIRPATVNDAPALLGIYEYYVRHTAISFEEAVPSLAEFEKRIIDTQKKYPYFIAESDGSIVGYAYAHTFIDCAAYNHSVETTIYLSPAATKKGIGKKLYATLEAALRKMGVTNMYACIAHTDKQDDFLTDNSEKFHEHIGFSLVGVFRKCGYKFGRWYNMVWMEKIIADHEHAPEKIIPFNETPA